MNEQSDFERFVADQLGSAAVGTPPESAITETIARAGGSRRLPKWLALVKEPPMRTNSHTAVGSPTMRVAAILAATLLLALALAAAGAGVQRLSAAGPIVVAQDGSGDFTTIQEAVAAANDSDEILIKPATYSGPIDIDKDVVLRGEDRDGVIIEFGEGCAPTDPDDFMKPESCPQGSQLYDRFWFGDGPYGLLVVDSNAEISGLTVRRAPTTNGSGIVIRGGAPSISSITFDDVNNLYVHGGSAALISDSDLGDAWVFVEERSPATVEGSAFYAIVANTDNTTGRGGPSVIRDNTTVGIAFNGQAIVEGNTLIAPEDEPMENDFYGQGIDVQRSDGWLIRDNIVQGFHEASGIDIVGGGNGTISGNTLTDNSVAMGLGSGDHVVEGNVIQGGRSGIVIAGGEAQLADNTVEGVSFRGIAIGAVSRPVLSGNRSCGNGENLWVADSALPEIDDSNEICEDAGE